MYTAPDEIAARRPTWADIDLGAFSRNVDAILSRLPAGSGLIAVLKANAYGHGSVELARVCQARGDVPMLAVALVEGAIDLRRAGISLPILILGTVTEHQVAAAVENGLSLSVTGPEVLESLLRWRGGAHEGPDVPVHLELDSGMGRSGLLGSDLEAAANILRANPWIRVDAIYTHYANAPDPADTYTGVQRARFAEMLGALRSLGISAPLHHAANSAATLRGLVSPGDSVRVGIALYGAEVLDDGTRLEPVMTWKTAIARLKEVPAGFPVGYGLTFITSRPSRIATLPVGYADGYNRLLSNRGEVLLHGRRVPVVGRVSMDLVTIDVTDVELAAVGDPVVLMGRQGDEEISAEEIAAKIGTISYEVLCAVGWRVPRLYRGGSQS